jgi:hypothetical protein
VFSFQCAKYRALEELKAKSGQAYSRDAPCDIRKIKIEKQFIVWDCFFCISSAVSFPQEYLIK